MPGVTGSDPKGACRYRVRSTTCLTLQGQIQKVPGITGSDPPRALRYRVRSTRCLALLTGSDPLLSPLQSYQWPENWYCRCDTARCLVLQGQRYLLQSWGSQVFKRHLKLWLFLGCIMSQHHDCLIGLVVKASTSRAEDLGFESHLRQDFSGFSHTTDLKIGTPETTLPGAWHYRVSAGTGQPGVSML